MTDELARLFVALELPREVRDELVVWRSSVAPEVPGLRMVAPEALHVTLCFLGWRSVEQIEAIAAACRVAAAEPVLELRLGSVEWLPARRPRVLAVAIADAAGALVGLQSGLSAALQAGGWYAPEARSFLGHVTAARVAKGARVRRVALAAPPTLAFQATVVTLFRSYLGAAGARYEPLATVQLGTAAGVPDPVAVVRRFHAAQARAYAVGELGQLRTLLSDDVVWHVPGHSAIAGEHRGVESVLAYFEARRRHTDATFEVTVHGAAQIGARVVQLAGGRAVVRGQAVSWETVGVFRVDVERIVECWLVPFDQDAFDQIWS